MPPPPLGESWIRPWPMEKNAEEKARNMSQRIVTKSAGLSSDVVRKSSRGSILLGSLFYILFGKTISQRIYVC